MSEFIFKIMEASLIAGFITSIVVSVFASIIMNLLLKQKRSIRNSGKPVVVYGQKAIEQIAKYCVGGTINTKDLLEHPSTKVKKRDYGYCATTFNIDIAETDEFNNIVKALESKDEKPSLIVLDTLTDVKDSCSQHCKT